MTQTDPRPAPPVRPMVWLCLAAVVIAVVVMLATTLKTGLLVLTAELVVLAIGRAIGGGEAWRIARRRPLDVLALLGFAAAFGYLAFSPGL